MFGEFLLSSCKLHVWPILDSKILKNGGFLNVFIPSGLYNPKYQSAREISRVE